MLRLSALTLCASVLASSAHGASIDIVVPTLSVSDAGEISILSSSFIGTDSAPVPVFNDTFGTLQTVRITGTFNYSFSYTIGTDVINVAHALPTAILRGSESASLSLGSLSPPLAGYSETVDLVCTRLSGAGNCPSTTTHAGTLAVSESYDAAEWAALFASGIPTLNLGTANSFNPGIFPGASEPFSYSHSADLTVTFKFTDASPIPLPASLPLLLGAFGGLALRRRTRRAKLA